MKETSLELLDTANQTFSLVVNDVTIQLFVRTYKGLSYCSVYLNDELLEAGRKAMPNRSVFSNTTNLALGGKFVFKTKTDEYPNFSGFEDGKFVLTFVQSA